MEATMYEDLSKWRRRRRKKRIIWGIVIAVLVIALILLYVYRNRIIPWLEYGRAELSETAGNTQDAIDRFSVLGDYKDATARATKLAHGMQADDSFTDALRAAEIGDVVTFGHYEQDDRADNGKEPIRWIVFAKENGRVLLWSESVLDEQPYHNAREDITWEKCTLRTWLNGPFYEAAFSETERALIAKTKLLNPNNTASYTSGGKDTPDKVFILSFAELVDLAWRNHYIDDIYAMPSRYAVKQGVDMHSGYGTCCWWIRTPGAYQACATYCDMAGSPIYSALANSAGYGVRPAIWILAGE